MKSYLPEMSRSMSVEPKHHKSSLSSILRDPSKSKLKHNRSVRFLEPEDYSSEESLDNKSVCQQQTKAAIQVVCQPFMNDFIRLNKRESYMGNPANNAIPQPPVFIKKREEFKMIRNPKNVIAQNSAKIKPKKFHSSASPKFEPKIINFGFRDKNFYEKLNKFICNKVSSPKKTDKFK